MVVTDEHSTAQLLRQKRDSDSILNEIAVEVAFRNRFSQSRRISIAYRVVQL